MAERKHRTLQWLHRATPLLGVVLFAFALWLLHRELRSYRYADLVRELRELPRARVWLSVGLTAVSYAVLTLYDALGVRYVRRSLSYGRIAMASLVGYGVSMTLGFPLLTGAPLRYRLYSRWGLSAGEIARIIAFYSTTFWLGLLAVGGAALLLDPPTIPDQLSLNPVWLRPLGALLLGLLTAYFILAALGTRIRIRGFQVEMPSLPIAVAQVVSSSLDWVVAAAVLYVLLPAHAPSFAAFFVVYVVGQSLGHASHVPGGVGVFESAVLFFLSPAIPAPQVLGALLAWRAIYYLLPLIAAVLTLAAHELRRVLAGPDVPEAQAGWFGALGPQVLAVTSFIAGALLLLSGATPSDPARLARLLGWVPLAVPETAHLLASVAGVSLLLLGQGLQMRLAAAWRAAVPLLLAGVLLSLLKGLDYEEAAAAALALGALLTSRGRFRRNVSLRDEPLTAGWLVAAGVVITASLWFGVFAYGRVDFTPAMWLSFSPGGDAARYLRASSAVALVVVAAAAARALRPAPRAPHRPDAEELEAAAAIVARSPRPEAHLALLGDKSLMFNPSRSAFVMYAVAGRSWVALGDPVGPPAEAEELAWRFREEAERNGGWPVFYQTLPDHLALYTEMGLTLVKLGEEAVVRLEGFSLQGEPRRGVRNACRRVRARGGTLEVVPPGELGDGLAELQEVSAQWLERRKAREKGFSMGRLDAGYLARLPVARVRLGGRTVAFATLWPGCDGSELTVDLLRFASDAPAGVMEFLLVELMRWGREQGYHNFSLGMAPLLGLEAREQARRWDRTGSVLFRHGEHFRDLHGLRRYKELFGAEWRLRYLAAPGAMELPRILESVAGLIAGPDGGAPPSD